MSGQIISRNGQSAILRLHPQELVDRPLSAMVRDYADGETTGLHLHARTQLLYASRGVMRIETEAAHFIVPPGRALWVPARLVHGVTMLGRVAMRSMFLREDAARIGPPTTAVLNVSPLLRELILAACAEPLEWEEAGRNTLLMGLMLDEIGRAAVLPLGVPAVRDARLQRLAAALIADPASPLGLEEWATVSGASVRTLSRLFRRDTGMSFGRWRQLLRLTEAAARLGSGMPLGRVAAAVGYSSASAFGAAYRATFGVPPGRAR